MLKELMKCIREYKKPSILAPVLVSLEVVMECTIPFLIASVGQSESRQGQSFP